MTFLLLLLAHFAADFTHLSRPWMLKAKQYGTPIFPIACHGFVHGVLCAAAGNSLIIGLIVFVTHTLIDIGKGRLNAYNEQLQSVRNIWHWYLFGADQFAHIAILYLCFYYL